VIAKLRNEDAIKGSRIHPISILSALRTYASNHGMRGKLTWNSIPQIIDALDDAFYVAFKNVKPTGKRRCLALDVSGSMTMANVGDLNLTPRDVTAVMAMATMKAEPNYGLIAFSREIVPLNLSPKMRLDTVIKTMGSLPFGGTDCAQPMIWALKNKIDFDSFEIYTDNETWAGNNHPIQALKEYRQKMGIQSKYVAVGTTATEVTTADPNDPFSLDVAGFDSSTPAFLADFVRE
jgi:60 kDa SS-A/Ro ribonucleoprotein